MRLLPRLFVAGSVLFSGSLLAGPVVITAPSPLEAFAQALGGPVAQTPGIVSTVPSLTTVSAESQRPSIAPAFPANATLTADYSHTATQTNLLGTYSLSRGQLLGETARVFGLVIFTVSANSTYSLSGDFAIFDQDAIVSDDQTIAVGPSLGKVAFSSRLLDVTGNSVLFANDQQSFNTDDEAFVLGQAGGDASNGSFGSLTGSLVAGHTYRWTFAAETFKDTLGRSIGGGSTASGQFRLTIDEQTPSDVPEPQSLALVMLALGGAALARRRRSA